MCDNWKQSISNNYSCPRELFSSEGEFTVTGQLAEAANQNIMYWAAAPPTYLQSYTGTGLPYPNATVAYDTDENKGMVKADSNGNYTFQLKFPNAYYNELGTNYVAPCYHIKLCNSDKIYTISLENGIPFRTLTYPNYKSRTTPLFYDGRDELPIRTQEQILRDSGYPSKNKMPDNFWGLKPPA